MWKAPHRPAGEVTQSCNDGVVRIYSVSDAAAPGWQPKPVPTLKVTLRYQERTMGIQRYYAGMQNQVELRRVIRVPRAGDVTSQDIAVTEDDRQYRVDLVQAVQEVWPACVDLTLAAVEQVYDVSELDTEGTGERIATSASPPRNDKEGVRSV